MLKTRFYANDTNNFSNGSKTYTNIEDELVQYCRKAFKGKYQNMWIDPLYFDGKYLRHTTEFFSEVGTALYPKITNLRDELKRRGYHNLPKPLHQCKTKEELERVREEWEEYRSVVWDIIHTDIKKSKEKGVKPVFVVVSGIRYQDRKVKDNKKAKYREKITSVQKVEKIE